MEMKKELAEAIVNPASYKDFEKIHHSILKIFIFSYQIR